MKIKKQHYDHNTRIGPVYFLVRHALRTAAALEASCAPFRLRYLFARVYIRRPLLLPVMGPGGGFNRLRFSHCGMAF
jgi:hypothetical protein